MARPKGSKNKPTEEKPQEIEQETEDLLGTPESEPQPPKVKKPIGYHPISGAEVWE